MKNWYKKAQAISADSFEPHSRIIELKRHLSAEDEEGNYLDIVIVPVASSRKDYITVQLDARHGGSKPGSSTLSRLYETAMSANTPLNRVEFVDDAFDEEEAKLPKGSYKRSSLEMVLGPGNPEQLKGTVDALCRAWETEASKMIKLNLISSYSISDAKYRTISQEESQQSSEKFDKIFSRDVEQARIFLCRLGKFARANPGIATWIDDVRSHVTDWTWRAIHAERFPESASVEEYCSKPIDREWIGRFSSNMESPVIEIFKYVSGEKDSNFDQVMEVIRDMPSEAAKKRGIEAFIGYVARDGEETYIDSWIRQVARDPEMLSLSVLGHPWAVSALSRKYPELAVKLKDIQKK
jgi:hypothetical protein